MADVIEQLESMNTPIPSELAIALLISSIDAVEMQPITAAVKTLPDAEATREKVKARLIDEEQPVKPKSKIHERLNADKRENPICGKVGHDANRCWKNPANHNNRLGHKTDQLT